MKDGSRKLSGYLLVCAVVLLTTATAAEAARVEESVEQTFSVRPGEELVVRTSNGPVRISSWDRPEVRVVAVKVAEHWQTSRARQELERIEVVLEQRGGAVRVESRLPRPARASPRVEYTITVPKRFDLDVQTSNGRIEVLGVEGSSRLRTSNGRVVANGLGPQVTVTTSNGRIEADGLWGESTLRTSNGRIAVSRSRGSLDLRTSNGSVGVAARELEPTDSVTITTSNGAIELGLPSQVRADVEARTSNGRIHSDFPVTTVVHGDTRGKELRGAINGGGARLELRTSNGSIRLVEQ